MKKRKINNFVKLKNEPDVNRLYLYGDISDFDEDFTISAKKVIEALEEVKTDDLEIHLNSYGGDMFEGIAISNYLKNSGKNIVVVIDGIAASAASIVAMAGNTIKMPKNAELMIHNPWTLAIGNSSELRKIADDMDKAQTSLEETYMTRFNGSREELQELLENETYLTADEAFELGLCDEVIDEVQDEISASVSINDYTFDELVQKVAAKIKPATVEEKETVETPKEVPAKAENKILRLLIKE